MAPPHRQENLQRLRGWGLRIESTLPIPGALPDPGHAPPDIRVEAGDATLHPGDAGKVVGPYCLERGSLLFTMPAVGRFLAHAGGTLLTVESEPEADPELLSAMLIATALPAVLWRRGEILLHAGAAVPLGERAAIAFAGSSGSGKSTLLRALVDAGAEAVADDSLRVQPGDGSPMCSGLPGVIHLRGAAAASEPSSSLPPERVRTPVPPARQRMEAPLGALIVLEAPGRTGPGAAPVRLPGADALAALLRHLHRPRIPRLLGETAALLPRLAKLAATLPVYSWSPQGRLPGFQLADLKLPAGWADEGSKERHGGPL